MGPETITVDALREMLERGQPVTVVDVRTASDRAEWTIPGSLHVDAYEALNAGDAGGVTSLDLPRDRPVVTVCGAGRTSLLAARALRDRGFDAHSLEGGMKAWSLAWNVAEVPLAGSAARVVQLRRTGKGCLSYLVAAEGVAAVVDPALPPEVYLGLAAREEVSIVAVLETHVHADHLSRARTLAERSGATLYLPDQERVRFPFTALWEGDEIAIGAARLTALHTPGHTPESTCYLLDGRALLTGDTLFLDGVGRPDLEASPAEARERAAVLFRSLERLLALPPETLVLPGHTAGPAPFDGAPIAAPLGKVRERVAALPRSPEAFVEQLLAHLPPAPPNHHRIVELNEAGLLPEGDPAELEAGANRCAVGSG